MKKDRDVMKVIGFLLLALVVYAQSAFALSNVSKPYNFYPNTGISSAAVNANFDALYSGLNGLINTIGTVRFSSEFATLDEAVTAIGTNNVFLKINTPDFPVLSNLTVPANITIRVDSMGSINQATHTLTIRGYFEAGDYQVFKGSGTIAMRTANPYWWGAKMDGLVDDTVAWNAAIACLNTQPSYGVFRFPAGQSRITSALTPITVSNYKFAGAGRGASILYADGTTNYTALTFGKTLPLSYADFTFNAMIQGFQVRKTGSGQRTMVQLNGWSGGIVKEILCNTGYSNAYITGEGDIGLAVFGHAENTFEDIELGAVTPLYLGSDDGAISGNGVDQTVFHNLDMYSMTNDHPLIKVAAGASFGNLAFTGEQTWIGGSAGFYLVDTGSTSNSGNLHIENARREDNTTVTGTRASGYGVDIELNSSNMVQMVTLTNCQLTVNTGSYMLNGVKLISSYTKLLMNSCMDGGGSGQTILNTTAKQATDSVTLVNCNGFSDASMSLSGYSKTFNSGGIVVYSATAKDTAISPSIIVNGGTSSTWASVDISASVPASATKVWGFIGNSATSASSYVMLSPTNSTSGEITVQGASGGMTIPFMLPVITSQTLWYEVSGGGIATVYITGYSLF